MTSFPLKTVVKVRHVPPPFRGVGRGTFYTRKLHRGDLLLTDIGPCVYNFMRHEAGFQVRDTANRTTAYDLEGTLMYLVNAGDSAEGAVWPVGYTRSQQRKTTLAWRPNAEYTTVLRRTTGRRTTGRRKRWYLALRLIRDVLPEDQLLAQNYMVGNQH